MTQVPSIGTYKDCDIPEWWVSNGQRFDYDRIAQEGIDGSVPLSQLRQDEFVVWPGLIYRRSSA